MKTVLTRSKLLSAIGLIVAAGVMPGVSNAYDKGEGIDPITTPDSSVKYDSRTSRSFAFDNDILVPGSRDQDYTYGLNLTFTGIGSESHWASAHGVLGWIDQQTGFVALAPESIHSSKVEYGLFGFTPEDISLSDARDGDRPYASLVYVSSSTERYQPQKQVSWQSTLTLGFLGLGIVGDVQDIVHRSLDGKRPQGWDNQISEGGEPTARYSLARQQLIYQNASNLEIKSTVQGSIGFITEASWSLSLRAGNIQTPWVSFNPELASYGEKSNPGDVGKVSEQYFWTGVSVKARAYNAFLQGQFRSSELDYNSDELNHGIIEAWMGYTVALDDGYSFTYSIRGHTSELKQGVGDRDVLWGGLQITKTSI